MKAIKHRKPTGIKDIASLAGISTGTVDRVLYNRGRVAKQTREKVLQIVKDLNYTPNLLARRLASDKVYTIAVLIPMETPDNAYWKYPLEGIEKAENELSGYGVVLHRYFFSLKNEATFIKASNKLLASGPDAVLMAPVFHKESENFLDACEALEIPYIFIDSRLPHRNYCSYFGQEARESGYLAAKLMKMGLPEDSEILIINFVSKLDNHPHFRDREEGFRIFFRRHQPGRIVSSVVITPGEEDALSTIVSKKMTAVTKGIFVTSGAHKAARVLSHLNNFMFIGYDLTPDNLNYLKAGFIDFLICQKPVSQGYHSMMALFNHLVQTGSVARENLMPLEIITRENYKYYLENGN